MLKGEDVLVLLKLFDAAGEWTVRSLSEQIAVPKSTVQRSIQRLEEARLLNPRRRRPDLARAEEFLIHGLPYSFPARLGAETRGIPTAWGARPLVDQVTSSAGQPPVWPYALGTVRGASVQPLCPSVPEVALHDEGLWSRLALLDALRLGDARIRGLAEDELRKGFRREQP